MKKINVTIWNEFRHEKKVEKAMELYPNGLHAKIKEYLDGFEELNVRLAALDDEDQGLNDEILNNTDVLIWWGHMYHGEVKDELAGKIADRVFKGQMGFIALHSAHESKPFKKIVGTTGRLSWGDNQREVVWNLFPTHPIAEGIPTHFTLESEELYSEPFLIPQPDALVFASWFEHGNLFRSGACFLRGLGRVFYFQPGHETCQSYHNPHVLRVIKNAFLWVNPSVLPEDLSVNQCTHILTKVTDEF